MAKAGWVLLAAAGIGMLAGKPAMRLAREWRCDRNLRLAEEAVAEGDWLEARDRSLAVLLLRSTDLRALGLLESAMAALRDPRQVAVGRYLMLHPEGGHAERLRGWLVIVGAAPLGVVAQAWNSLPEELQQEPAFLLGFADRLTLENRLTEAVQLFGKMDLADPPTDVERRVLAILLASGKREAQAQAQQRLLDRIKRGKPDLAILLGCFDQVPLDALDAGLGEALAGWLEAGGERTAEDRLRVARHEVAAAGAEAAGRIEQVTAAWSEREPVLLVKWLLDIDEPERALAVAPDRVTADPRGFAWRCEAWKRLERWLELSQALKNPPPGYSRLNLHCDETLAAARMGDTAKRSAAWANAMGEAKISDSANGYLDLSRRAAKDGLADESERAMVEAIRAVRGPLPLYADLKPLVESLHAKRMGEELLDIVAVYQNFEPGNPVLMTQYCYLAGLYGYVETGFIKAQLEPVLERLPSAIPVRCTLAVAALLESDPARALGFLELEGLDWNEAAPGYRMIRAVALVSGGRKEEGLALLKGLPWDKLLAVERQFCEGRLAVANAADQVPALPETEVEANAAPNP